MDNLIAQSQLQLIRLYFSIVGAISPRIAAKKAHEMMETPRLSPLKAREKTVLEMARWVAYEFRGEHIQGYHWGEDSRNDSSRNDSSRKVVLIHGWEGHAGHFGHIIPMLIENDCTIVAVDAPSHGESAQQPTSMFDFRAFVAGFLRQQQPDIVITHSFGSVAAITALEENQALEIDKLVMITSPDRFADRIHQVSNMLNLSPRVEQRLIHKIEDESGYVVDELNVSDYAPRTNVGAALIVHGQNDQIVPMEWSQRIVDKWDKASLVEIADTGHYRILWREETRRTIAEFLFNKIFI